MYVLSRMFEAWIQGLLQLKIGQFLLFLSRKSKYIWVIPNAATFFAATRQNYATTFL